MARCLTILHVPSVVRIPACGLVLTVGNGESGIPGDGMTQISLGAPDLNMKMPYIFKTLTETLMT